MKSNQESFSSTFSLAVLQMNSVDSYEKNFSQIQDLTKDLTLPSVAHLQDLKAKKAEPLWVFLPENCLFQRIREGDRIPPVKIGDPIFSKLLDLASQQGTAFHLGSVPMQESSRVFNASVIVNPWGEGVRVSYRKVHLFDIHLDGRAPIRESDLFTPGPGPEILEIGSVKIGQSICYDLRFSELYSKYSALGAQILLVPASFLVPTGQAHWETLLRARAIESQAFVVAAAQSGTHHGVSGGVRETYGHSMIVDPWGRVLQELPNGKGVLQCDLDLSMVSKVRLQIPMSQHRKLRS